MLKWKKVFLRSNFIYEKDAVVEPDLQQRHLCYQLGEIIDHLSPLLLNGVFPER